MNRKLLCLLFLSAIACAQAESPVCTVYFKGTGCPHCAKTDPLVLGEMPLKYNGSFVAIEYEVYQSPENAQLMRDYQEKVGITRGMPQIVYSSSTHVAGDKPIIESLDKMINGRLPEGSMCTLLDSPRFFEDLEFSRLPGRPRIWFKDRVLIKVGDDNQTEDNVLKTLLFSEDVFAVIRESGEFESLLPQPVQLSGSKITFSNAVKGGGWVFEWNEKERRKMEERVEYTSTIDYLLVHMDLYMTALLVLAIIMFLLMLIKERTSKSRK